MKRLLVSLIIMMLTLTTTSSQTISGDTVVQITATQLKEANLIFAEHQKMSQEIPLLKAKIENLEAMNVNYANIDSLRLKQLDNCNTIINDQNKEITNLKKEKRSDKWWTRGSILASIVLAIICVVK